MKNFIQRLRSVVTKQHVKGALSALALLGSLYGGQKAYKFVQIVNALQGLTQTAAQDQKTGQAYSVADVLQAIAAERLQQIAAAKQAESAKPISPSK